MTHGFTNANVTFVLCRPKFPENIGSAARAMKNMGFERLRVVTPERFDDARMKMMSTHAAADVVDGIEIFDTLEDALADTTYVVGTTARLGRNRKQNLFTPPLLAEHMMPLAANNQIALVFGPEDKGLENADLRLCHSFVNIPTAGFSSLNLSQAVMVLAYELHRTSFPAEMDYAPTLANRFELDGLFEHMKDVFIRIDFMKSDNPDYWLDNFRHLAARNQLKSKEVQILRGVLSQIDWYGGHMFTKGKAEASSAT